MNKLNESYGEQHQNPLAPLEGDHQAAKLSIGIYQSDVCQSWVSWLVLLNCQSDVFEALESAKWCLGAADWTHCALNIPKPCSREGRSDKITQVQTCVQGTKSQNKPRHYILQNANFNGSFVFAAPPMFQVHQVTSLIMLLFVTT